MEYAIPILFVLLAIIAVLLGFWEKRRLSNLVSGRETFSSTKFHSGALANIPETFILKVLGELKFFTGNISFRPHDDVVRDYSIDDEDIIDVIEAVLKEQGIRLPSATTFELPTPLTVERLIRFCWNLVKIHSHPLRAENP